MPASSFTMNPVTPSSTISGNAPESKAITGVPQARDSIATSELVSGAVLGMSRHLAAARRAAFLCKPKRSEEATAAVEQRFDLLPEVLLVCGIRINLAANQ